MDDQNSIPVRTGSGRRPHLLYIAFYFPPTRASGVFRSLATANHFVRQGWDVTVITPQREFFEQMIRSYDSSLESQILPEVEVERVYFPGRPWQNDIRKYSRMRAYFPSVSARLYKWTETRFFPDRYAPWIPRVIKRARAMHRAKRFDAVLATGNPYASFGAAWLLGRLLRIPYAIDYRDSWTLNQFTNEPFFPKWHRTWWWERRILKKAARVFFVNQAMLDWHAGRYPAAARQMRVALNGYDPEALEGLAAPTAVTDRPLRFGFVGTVTSVVPIEEFVDGWRLVRKEPGLEDAEVHFYGHLGFFPNAADGIRELLRLDDEIGVFYQGPVPKAEIACAYGEIDVLLLILPGSQYVTSGKVFEYVATGRPVVSVHEPESAAREVLEGYPLWFPAASMEAGDIRDAIVAAAQAARSITPEQVAAGKRHALGYTRSAQLAAMEHGLRESLRSGAGPGVARG